MPGTPITPIPTLPTISEVKGPEHANSKTADNNDAKSVPERRKSRRMDEIKEENAKEKVKQSGGEKISFLTNFGRLIMRLLGFTVRQNLFQRKTLNLTTSQICLGTLLSLLLQPTSPDCPKTGQCLSLTEFEKLPQAKDIDPLFRRLKTRVGRA